jgi:fibronectin type 3 domain-containing protein
MVDTPPKPPIDLDYTILPNDDVYLTWDIMSPPDPDLLGYVVYRSRVSGAQYQPLHYGALLNKFYRDSDAGGGVYYYVVTSIDLGGNESDYSFELTVDRR